ncbi:unnamed protein product [Rodentolepis nana]|uniref:Expressed conserved protein n=1 Tax=Rodentolepis nana TaxID=102285 RepID=A0A158QJI1_RODNA|nr:unnamed protein product [Rodentolepis nana]
MKPIPAKVAKNNHGELFLITKPDKHQSSSESHKKTHKSRAPIKIPVHPASRTQAGFGHGGCPVHGAVRPVLSAGRCMHSPPRSYACPCCVQPQKYLPTKSYENSSNSDAYYTNTSSSSSESSVGRADHGGIKIIPVQQKRSRSHDKNHSRITEPQV